MKRIPPWGSVVLTNDESWDFDFPQDFLWVGDDLFYDDNDGKGLQTQWYACDDKSPNSPLLAWHWQDTFPGSCFLISVQVVPL